jgi:hypothetical protein
VERRTIPDVTTESYALDSMIIREDESPETAAVSQWRGSGEVSEIDDMACLDDGDWLGEDI